MAIDESLTDGTERTDVTQAPSLLDNRWVPRLLLAATITPIVVAIIRALTTDWFPISDNALLYLRVEDVLTSHHPWLGSWTSASQSLGINVNNPGPIYQDLLAPFAKIFSPGPGAALGVGTLNILSVVGISSAARRIGGLALQRWMLLATAALAWTMGSELLIDIWQAHALLLPFLALLVLLIGVMGGHTWCVAWALGVASVIVQTHISYAVFLAIVAPICAAGYVLARRQRPHQPLRAALRSKVVALTVASQCVLWFQTVYEQFFGPGQGNISRLLTNPGGGDLKVGPGQAFSIAAKVFALPPWWLRRGFSTSVPNTRVSGTEADPQLIISSLPGTAVAVLLVVALLTTLGVLTLACHRRGLHTERNACILALVGLVSAVFAVSRLIVGPVGFAAHHVRFLWPLAVFVHVVAAWAIAGLLAGRERVHRGINLSVAALTVAVAAAATPFAVQPQGPVADYPAMITLRKVFPELEKLRDVQPVLFDLSTLRYFESYSSTVMLELQQLGIEFRVTDEGMVRQLGDARRADGTEPARIFQYQGPEAVLYDGTACLLVRTSQLSPSEEAVAVAGLEELATALGSGDVVVDDAALVGDDAAIAQVLADARAGDHDAGVKIVIEGYLGRWFRAGQVTGSPDLAGLVPLIDRYSLTVYALFSDQTAPCR